MKITSIKISNMLSFKYVDMQDCQEITFNDDLNLMIGPNGSGKSNFIEILNKIFKNGIISPCVIDHQTLENYDRSPVGHDLKNTIRIQSAIHGLDKNHDCDSKEQKIELKIKLSGNDYENLYFILDHINELNSFLEKYTTHNTRFNSNITKDELKAISEIVFYLTSNSSQRQFLCTTNSTDIGVQFIQNYFFSYRIIQYLILLTNYREKTKWTQLKNTFALIGSYRNYHSIQDVFTINQPQLGGLIGIDSRIVSDSARIPNNEEPFIFDYVKNKLTFKLNHIENELTEGVLSNPNNQSALDFLKQDYEFNTLNELLDNYLGITLEIKHERATLRYVFNFKDNKKRIISFADLSAGQKGIIHFIFSVYGFDLESGLMVIDEPEIHLHPQIQEKYLKIIFDTINKMHLQFIIVTHSPIFVNEKTIGAIRRFYLDDGFTKVIIPKVGNKEKELIQILSYTNSSKIFFSDKVVLVEGDSDEYFFRFYFDKYKETRSISKNIDFLYIGGKDKIGYWKKFLEDCKINSYYVGDLDNVLGGQSAETIAQNSKNIFILKQGNLETYIGKIRHNKLENAIDFCKNRYDAWKTDLNNKEKIDELDEILNQIII